MADSLFRSEWAKKVDWKQGGTAARPAGKPPKAPITALEAYVQYLRSQVQKSVRSHVPDKEEQQSSVTILKVYLSVHLNESAFSGKILSKLHKPATISMSPEHQMKGIV